MPKCPKCGNPISPDEVICPFCGYEIEAEEVKEVFEEVYEERRPLKPSLTKIKLLFTSPREVFKDLAYYPENKGSLLILLMCATLSALTMLVAFSRLNVEASYLSYLGLFIGGFTANFILYLMLWLFLSFCYWIFTRMFYGKIGFQRVSSFLGYALITLVLANLLILILALIIVPQIPSETLSEAAILTTIQTVFSVPPFSIYNTIFFLFLAGAGVLYSYGIAEEFKTSFIKALVFSLFTTSLIILFLYAVLYF